MSLFQEDEGGFYMFYMHYFIPEIKDIQFIDLLN